MQRFIEYTPPRPAKRSKITHVASKDAGFCKSCQQLDLVKAFSDADEYFTNNWDLVLGLRDWKDARASFQGIFIANIEIATLCRPACTLCDFFWNVRLQDDARNCFEIRAFPSYWAVPLVRLNGSAFRNQDRTVQPSVLVVVPSSLTSGPAMQDGFNKAAIFRRHQDIPEKAIRALHIEPYVNMGILNQWISFCGENHGKGCPKPSATTETEANHIDQVPHIPGFRLIDCETREILPMPVTREYIALSYVWGVDPSGDELKWPRVVEDAAKVTVSLGFRYLWVDQLCIDQKDPEDKKQQVGCMHIIYQQAQLTIIAAAGLDARFGLAGVYRPRTVPSSCRLENMTLITTPESVFDSIRTSKWWTRGWTYQEGVLSRRRLVFTAEQVYYECEGMIACESIEYPSGLAHVQSCKYQEKLVQPGIFSGVEGGRKTTSPYRLGTSKQLEKRYDRVRSHVAKYAHRDLTHNSDKLNAFLGIFEANMLKSFFGILISDDLASKISPASRKTVFLTAQEGSRELIQALISWWHTNPDATRLPEFPSWSWAGWRGQVTASDNGLSDPYVSEKTAPIVQVMSNPGYPRLMYKMDRSAKSDLRHLPALELYMCNRLRFEALTVVAQGGNTAGGLVHVTISNSDNEDADFSLALSATVSADELATCWRDRASNEHGWEAIYVARKSTQLVFMILRPVRPVQYLHSPQRISMERIGLGWIDMLEFNYLRVTGLLESVREGYTMQ
ncbi:hypothetical protein FZEAL_5892 [Fusarium zealandicum]|uniref:Heterokaryon incompatibility domain-containing protein n=1 Tax=Fusarium zealandicum TaxID=1053134 RepID=A0A8H4UIX0_9HYPO|nr:hypothetical protein FZEAL_5892 [Fusarium zealandicum]